VDMMVDPGTGIDTLDTAWLLGLAPLIGPGPWGLTGPRGRTDHLPGANNDT
jgi:hypothetical protein